MLKPGLVSVTFRELSPERIVRLVAESGLRGIEWGGDVHVPHGDYPRARQVGRITRNAGLEVAAYGSYYRVGHSEDEGFNFECVMRTALALETKIIRVWAGNRGPEDADAAYRQMIIDESTRICELAAANGIVIAYEFHDGTLTKTAQSARALLEKVGHPNLRTYWQPTLDAGVETNFAALELLSAWLAGVHVFHWWPGETRHPLHAGLSEWSRYLAHLRATEVFALLEFVKDDSLEIFRADAATLLEILAEANNGDGRTGR